MNKYAKTIATVKRELHFREYVGADVSAHPKQKHTNNLTSNVPTSNTAITLIALIITIIVLLILAGVTLNMVIGENGLFGKANIAKEKNNLSSAQEILKLKIIDYKAYAIEKNEQITLENLSKYLSNDEQIEYASVKDNKVRAKLKDYKYIFFIDKDLNITEDINKENNDKTGIKVLYDNLPASVENLLENDLIFSEIVKSDDNIDYIINHKDDFLNYLLNNEKAINTFLGSDYALQEAKNNEEWKNAIQNSKYNNLLNREVKEYIATSEYADYTQALYAFDNDKKTYWYSNGFTNGNGRRGNRI